MLQLITLRKIQSRVVTDIVSWPGKDKEGAAAVTDRHAGDRNRYGVLFLRFEIRLPDAEIPKLYGAAGLARWDALARGLSVLTLPFYWTVVETLRKLVVVAVCAMMSESTQATARCVVLILIFSSWQLLVSRVRPYAANPLATLATGFERISLLHRIGSIDVNEVEVYLSVSLVLFLACATVFINLECGSSAEPVCEHFAIAAIGLLLFGVAVGLLTPVLSSLQNRRLRKARRQQSNEAFLSHAQGTGGDQCKLLKMLLWHRHGVRFWYDQDEHVINVQGMRDGITAARRYVLYLSVGALARPFVIFELVIALQLGKPIVFVHRECGLGGFAEERSPEEQQKQQDHQHQRQQRQLQRRYSRPEETAPLLGSATVVVAGAAAAGGAGGVEVEEVEMEEVEM